MIEHDICVRCREKCGAVICQTCMKVIGMTRCPKCQILQFEDDVCEICYDVE